MTLKCRMRRRSCDMINSTYSTRNVAVGAMKKSMAVKSARWFSRNERQTREGGLVRGRPVASHRGVADVDPELAQLGLDARRTPRRIRTPHVADQLPDRGIESWSTAPGPALPTPIGP